MVHIKEAVMGANRFLHVLCLALALTGCVSRAIDEDVQDRGPQVKAAPLPAAERMTVTIARFTNESIYGTGLFTDASGDRLGKQAADLLARHLMETQRFEVFYTQEGAGEATLTASSTVHPTDFALPRSPQSCNVGTDLYPQAYTCLPCPVIGIGGHHQLAIHLSARLPGIKRHLEIKNNKHPIFLRRL
jgi:hypothetical protein